MVRAQVGGAEESSLTLGAEALEYPPHKLVIESTRGTFADVVATAKPALRPLCIALRRLIVGLHRGTVEVSWPKQRIASFGVGPRKMTDHYAYIGVHASHVNLGFYHRDALDDRAGLLEGSGKKLCHVKIRNIADTRRPAIAALLRQAIEDRNQNATATKSSMARTRDR